ncbi:MAG: hypothetical protein DRQ89_14560 [Epsilonproteobacteria bacterium]|nr:MAG: hypothetical protein DRQ89_14560 [Campylobacterota bacterium]
MKKDINTPEIKNVTVVIKPEMEGEHWTVHLVNTNNHPLQNILVASEGYGKKEPNREETSILRQSFELLEANSSLQIELIDPEVFHLFYEYGITYYVDNEIYFKKFVFVPDSIISENLSHNELLKADVVTQS